VRMTSLPGTAACDVSTTVPVIEAVPWAKTLPEARTRNRPERRATALADVYLLFTWPPDTSWEHPLAAFWVN
jgi:hypothetical protein